MFDDTDVIADPVLTIFTTLKFVPNFKNIKLFKIAKILKRFKM